jgi:hypothetical protein
MGKIVDGVELLRLIRDGEIKENKTKIIDKASEEKYLFFDGNITDEQGVDLLYQVSDIDFATGKFEILSEEDEEIDIQAIIFFNEVRDLSTWSNGILSENQREIFKKIRELTKAVKQLDKKIKEKE